MDIPRTHGTHGAETVAIFKEWEIKEHIRALPTKADIQQLIATVEHLCKQAVEELREELGEVGNRVEVIENDQEKIIQIILDIIDITKYHEEALNTYRDQFDDFENGPFYIRGLPEKYHNADLPVIVQRLFHQIMGESISEAMEVDRVHRVKSTAYQNKEKPRDVICKMHKYSVKEAIMRSAWYTLREI